MRRLIVIVVGAGLALVGVAYATIPSNGVIDACYTKNGTLRVVDPTVSTAAGTPGTNGRDRAAGAARSAGAAGTDGRDRPAGAAGAIGSDGIRHRHE